MPKKAFVDTTVLTDAVLKRGERNRAALAALRAFDETELPVFAIKEFKAGPLKYWAVLHNKLLETGSLPKTIGFLRKCFRTPALQSTCFEALEDESLRKGLARADLKETYGDLASFLAVEADLLRLAVKTRIFGAWKRRTLVTSSVVCGLSCYSETAPREKGRRIEVKPHTCDPPGECSMAPDLKTAQGLSDLAKLREAVPADDRRENKKRREVLRRLTKYPERPMREEDCRDLGDAVFAFYAPTDAVVLTTNTRDHKPLAQALGKTALSPEEVLAASGE